VRFLLPDEIRLYGPETFSGTVLTDIGFTLGEHAWNEYSMFLVSSEQLALADADVVFSTAYGGTDSDEFRRRRPSALGRRPHLDDRDRPDRRRAHPRRHRVTARRLTAAS
jgi:ABC-type Fe3+-hydroxamate transport system substrate-binding protein